MLRFIITVSLGGILHAGACISHFSGRVRVMTWGRSLESFNERDAYTALEAIAAKLQSSFRPALELRSGSMMTLPKLAQRRGEILRLAERYHAGCPCTTLPC